MRVLIRSVPVCLLIGILGCGSSSSVKPSFEKVAPVSGTLTYQGKPLENYQVTFLPTDGRRPGVGLTDAAGKFKLGTNDLADGAPLGTNQVAVNFAPPSTDDATTGSPIEDPALLPMPKVLIPAKYGNPKTSEITQEVPSGGLTDLKLDLK